MRRALPRMALVLFLAAVAAWLAFNRDKFDLAALKIWMEATGPWAPITYVALFAMATVAFVPGAIFGLAESRP
jgi:uncharacterized membrane protein YdjX (TVP38/TMEM64 family)